MEELLELRACLEQQRYAEAFVLLREMEEMSKDDKINQVRRFIIILLLYLIKQHSAKKTTRSWDLSIYKTSFLNNCCYTVLYRKLTKPAIKFQVLE